MIDGRTRRRLRSARVLKARKAPAVILDTGCNGLGYVRSLAERGVPTIALDVWRDPALWSRYCVPLVVPDPDEDPHGLIRILDDLADALPRRPALLPTSDAFFLFTARWSKDLAAHYDFIAPPYEHALRAVDKRLQYEHARRTGVATVPTVFPEDSGIEAVASDVDYPCLLKPVLAHRWRKYVESSGLPRGLKLVQVDGPQALIETYRILKRSGLEFLVQDKVPGGDDRLWALQAYLDRSGAPRATFTKRKLRQYPHGFGDSCFQVGLRNEAVVQEGLRLLTSLEHRGCAGVEFKEDPRDSRMKLIEVNPRSLATVHHAVVSGVDLPYIHYSDVVREPVEADGSFEEGIKWANFGQDLPAFLQNWAAGEMDLAQWIQSWRGKRCYAFFEWRDPLPACVGLAGVTASVYRTILGARFTRASAEDRTTGSREDDRAGDAGDGADPRNGLPVGARPTRFLPGPDAPIRP